MFVISAKVFKTCGENDSRPASTQKSRLVNSRRKTMGKTSKDVDVNSYKNGIGTIWWAEAYDDHILIRSEDN